MAPSEGLAASLICPVTTEAIAPRRIYVVTGPMSWDFDDFRWFASPERLGSISEQPLVASSH